ncbi:MAG: outer membrane beta-barrel protein [Flavobacteriales bacterium]|nr:outer membrane beta-barrel protein [Flavobacteriales bacterium]
MKDKDNIEDLLQGAFDDFEMEADSRVWDNVEKELTKKSKKIIPIWWKIGLAASIAGGMAYMGAQQFFDSNSMGSEFAQTEILKEVNSNDVNPDDNSVDASEEERIIELELDQNIEVATIQNIAPTEMAAKDESSSAINSVEASEGFFYAEEASKDEEPINDNKIETHQSNDTNEKSSLAFTVNSNDEPTEEHKNSIAKESELASSNSAEDKVESEDNSVAENDTPESLNDDVENSDDSFLATNNSTEDKAESKDDNVSENESSLVVLNPDLNSTVPDEPLIKKEEEGKWLLAASYGTMPPNEFASTSKSAYSTSESSPQRGDPSTDYYSNNLKSAMVGSIDYDMPFITGVTFNYRVGKRSSIESGLQLIRVSAQTSGSQHEITYFGIPVNYSYKIIDRKKFDLYTSGGITFEIGLKHKRIDNEGNSSPYRYPGFHTTLNLGVGSEYKIGNRISLFVQPGMSVSVLNSLFSYYHYTDVRAVKRFWPSLYTGLRFNLN